MRWGNKESQALFKLIYEDTGQHHPAYQTRPSLRDDCIKYYDAFCLLSDCRMWSEVGPQPIQLSEIDAYLRMVGITDVFTKLKYARLIRRMDGVTIRFLNEKRKQELKK